jgi:uncharacterized membrane protein YccF (DUF307 family)
MRFFMNGLWFVFGGGFFAGISWWLLGCLMFVTIIGIPWGRSCFVIGQFSFFPFGREAISREVLNRRGDIGTGSLGCLGNAIWFALAGFWLAIAHVTLCATLLVTLIGIPFAIQHLKLAALALAPVGKQIVTQEEALSARLRNSGNPTR